MKLLIFLFGALWCASSAFPRIQIFRSETPPQCRDPTFACQDLESARLCNVVKPCIHDIWSTLKVPDDNDEVCDICKEMVKEARDQLLSNMTQEEIKEVFEGSCKLLPIKLVADACIKVVDEIIPELVEMLASRMDPTMVCTVSGMCFPSHDLKENHVYKLFKIILAKNQASKCDECTHLVQDAQAFIQSSSEAEVKDYIEKFCAEKIPHSLCDIIINHYLPEMYNYIKDTPAVEVCQSVGVCPKKCTYVDNKVTDELTCEFCEHVLQHVKDLVTANTTAEEFKTALLNFCKHVGSFSDRCTSLVNDYYDMLFDYIRKLDTKGMCTLMGLCDNQMCQIKPMVKLIPALEPRKRIPLMKLQPANRVQINDNQPILLIKLIPATILSKKDMKESNDIFQPLIPLEKFIHPVTVFKQETECALCKAFSFYLQNDLAGDRSKGKVQSVIDGICGKWMIEYPDECGQIVEKYSLKMQYAIAEGVDFESLCSNVKSCPLIENKPDKQLNITNKAGPVCDLCKDAMNEVQQALNDPAIKQSLKKMADQACNICPFKDNCVSFINDNIDAVIDILQQELKPDNICPALHLCAAGISQISVPKRIKDLECDMCKDVVSSFRQKLQDPSSKEMVLTFLEEGCARLPASLAAECKKFVDEEIDTLMNIIIQEMDPNSVCAILNICPASLPKEASNDLECELCKEVVTKVLDMVKDKKSEDEIEAALDKVCSYLPSSLATKCEDFVTKYTDLLITLLIEEIDPDVICQRLNACPSKVKIGGTKHIKDVECDLCEEVVTQLENLMKDKKTEDEIKSALDRMCSYLPSSLGAKCQNFVNNYMDLLISLLAQEMDPAMVCAALHACPTVENPDENQIKSFEKAKNLECEGCQYALHFLQNQLMDSATQNEVKEMFKKFCSVLPTLYQKNCEAFVDEYGSSFLVLIAQEIDPSKMCYQIQMCPNQSSFIKPEHMSMNPFHLDECSVCTTVVDYLDKMLEKDDIDQEITQVIERVCNVLPTSFHDKCSTMLETYGPYLLQMIGQLADSKQVCQDIDLCPRSPTRVHLIGGSKCTFGPSYWCKSTAHASACKAEPFCQKKVWNK